MLLRPHVCCCDHYHLWMETRIFRAVAIGNDIAHDINEQVGAQMEPRQQGVAHTALPKDPDVEDAYPQGEYSLNRGSRPDSYQEKIDYSQNAIEKDPSFAPAYAGLAAAFSALGENGCWNTRKVLEGPNSPPGRRLSSTATLRRDRLF